MSAPWGPQATGGVQRVEQQGGRYWILLALISPLLMATPFPIHLGDWNGLPISATVFACVVMAIMGLGHGQTRTQFAHGRGLSVLVILFFAMYPLLVYGICYAVGTQLTQMKKLSIAELKKGFKTERQEILKAESPSRKVMEVAAREWAKPGGAHLGWADDGRYVGAEARGATLVIAPPGQGKTTSVLIPSILVAPGAAVPASTKTDLMEATFQARAALGRIFQFDPGGQGETTEGVIQARWSPLVGIRNWDDARTAANRIAEPLIKSSSGEDNHFAEKGRDWLEVLFYAAVLGGHSISHVADWAQNPDSKESTVPVESALIYAAKTGDLGAQIAVGQHAGLLAIPDKERGSVKSTITRLLRIYGSVSAREVGTNPNFDPEEFVRSSDTLYITAPADQQKEYAPLIVGILDAIRFATYKRHDAESKGKEPKRPHVTFILDEANVTAQIPLPDIVGESGGQSLHVVVAVQDLSRAQQRWGDAAKGFLTLFGTKVLMRGVVEESTLNALSNITGEYDRTMTSIGESTTYLGPRNKRIQNQNPSYSTTRQKVLHQGDISAIPEGKALMFEASEWNLINTSPFFSDPLWQRVIEDFKSRAQELAQTKPAAHITGNSQLPNLEKE
jgi:type IV secretion system protein VirD4